MNFKWLSQIFCPRSITAYENECFSLNIKTIQILKICLNDETYARIKDCSLAKDIWNALNSIYLANNDFVHKSVNREQGKKRSWKEASHDKCPQEYAPAQSVERSSTPLNDDDDGQLEKKKEQT